MAADPKSAEPHAHWAGRWSGLPVDHLKRWEKRLYVPKSGGVALRKLAIRFQHLGRREEFRFETTNRAAAASQATEIFRFLKVNGWDQALAKFKPQAPPAAPGDRITVGEYIELTRKLGRFRARTFTAYAGALRTVAAETCGIESPRGSNKFDSKTGGCTAWRGEVDAIRLSELTPARITSWQRSRLARAGASPVARAAASRTANMYVRNARALFADAVRKELGDAVLLPSSPFSGVELLPEGSVKYHSTTDARLLVVAARSELKHNRPEVFKAFLLAMFGALRKAELDGLEWDMIDFARGSIRLRETASLALKTTDSAGEIPLDSEVLDELRSMLPKPGDATAHGQFVLRSHRAPRPDSARPFYRCAETFAALNAWLRSKGVDGQKPVHLLRKEAGAILASQHGLFVASRFLRHSSVQTTERHYADLKHRPTLGLGSALTSAPSASETESAA